MVYTNIYKIHVLTQHVQETSSGGSGDLPLLCHSSSLPEEPLP